VQRKLIWGQPVRSSGMALCKAEFRDDIKRIILHRSVLTSALFDEVWLAVSLCVHSHPARCMTDI
jgi:hypothetical protein